LDDYFTGSREGFEKETKRSIETGEAFCLWGSSSLLERKLDGLRRREALLNHPLTPREVVKHFKKVSVCLFGKSLQRE